jgi:hypothetical protein
MLQLDQIGTFIEDLDWAACTDSLDSKSNRQ